MQAHEVVAADQVRALLPEDQRFEYMDNSAIDEATRRFVCLAHFRRDTNHTAAFMSEHAREPMGCTCFFPVIHLAVKAQLDLQGARIIPASEVELPARILPPDPGPTMASVIAVDCTGTNYDRMERRAAEVADHALRLLRAGLREEHFLPDRQLRFRRGESVWFDDGASGWSIHPETGWDYEAGEDVLRRAASMPISSLPLVGGTDVECAAGRALRWFEQAQLAVDPLMELLFLMTALEAILGRKNERLKARGLALRRGVLSCKLTQSFTHPLRIYALYDEVRSVAIHGGDPEPVSEDVVVNVAWDVRRAINEFLEYAQCQRIVKRSRLLKALDEDQARADVERHLERGLGNTAD